MLIKIILILAVLYLAIGLIFAIFFVLKGVDKIDEGAQGGSWGFRIMIIPGTMVFWPLLLKKWLHIKSNGHDEIPS
jgi:hypothetical protein